MLQEKPRVAPRSFPALFTAIINNDEQLRITKALSVIDIKAYRVLRGCKREYMKSAEQIYAGTKNNGKNLA